MPQIAQQDYIYIPIMNGLGVVDESLLTVDIEDRLYNLAKDGRINDVVLTDTKSISSARIVGVMDGLLQGDDSFVKILYFDLINEEIAYFSCSRKSEHNDEPEPDAQ